MPTNIPSNPRKKNLNKGKLFWYIEVVEDRTDVIIGRVNVTDRQPNAREKVERGMQINMDHEQYSTRIIPYTEKHDTF